MESENGNVREKRGQQRAQGSGSVVFAGAYETRHTPVQCLSSVVLVDEALVGIPRDKPLRAHPPRRPPTSEYPFLDAIEASFGNHDLSDLRAHANPAARDAAGQLGAHAYAHGNDVAFAGSPDLHTAAHEAAHTIQQQKEVALSSDQGEEGDAYERHADAVADKVVAGESAESLLDAAPGGGTGVGVQLKADPGADGFNENAAAGTAVHGGADFSRMRCSTKFRMFSQD